MYICVCVGVSVSMCGKERCVCGCVLEYVPNGPRFLRHKVLSILKKISSLSAKITL